jgi:hypothetical protein
MESDSESNSETNMEYQYNPEEPIYYNLKAKDILLLGLPRGCIYYDNVYISAYTVNTDGECPFIRYLLTNSKLDPKLKFPRVPLFSNLNTSNLINYTQVCLFGLLMLEEYELFSAATNFTGFYESNNNLYMFFDITKLNLRLDDVYKSSHLWLALMDEIVNHKCLCDIKMDPALVNLFLCNQDLCFLVDANNENYEIPVICYTGKPINKLNFTFIFGEPKCDKTSILGPFYYFTDFHNAIKDGVWSENRTPEYKSTTLLTDGKNGSYTEGGIIRFAVFPGNTKYIENKPDDPNDESDTKYHRLQDENLDQNMERLTMRISDHDGNWAQNYDSVYLGSIELDNGTFIDKPYLVVKKYKQQISLSYHLIDKKTIDADMKDYSIL